jgi:hypothetical protein
VRWRQEDVEFKASLDCIARPCFKKKKKKEGDGKKEGEKYLSKHFKLTW